MKSKSRKKAAFYLALFDYLRQFVLILRGLVLIPLYIKYLGGELYGLWAASGGVLAVFSAFDLGLGRMLIQRVSHFYGKKDFKYTSLYYFNGILIYILIGIIVLILGYLISGWITTIINTPQNHFNLVKECFQLSMVFTFIRLMNVGLTGGSEALLRPVVPRASMAIFALLGVITTIILLNKGVGLLSIPIGYLVQESGVFIFNSTNFIYLLRKLKSKININLNIIKEYFELSPYLMGAKFGKRLIENLEPTLISIMINPSMAASYRITSRAASFIRQFMNTTISANFSSFSHLVGEGRFVRANKIVNYILSFGLVVGGILFISYIALNKSFISLWVDEENYLGMWVTGLIAFSYLGKILQNYYYSLIVGLGEIKKSSLNSFFEAFARLLLIYLLGKSLGIWGVPIAVMLTTLISILFYTNQLKKILNIQKLKLDYLNIRTIIILIILIIASFPVSFYLNKIIESWFLFALAGLIVLIILFLLLTLTNKNITSMVKQIIQKIYMKFRQ